MNTEACYKETYYCTETTKQSIKYESRPAKGGEKMARKKRKVKRVWQWVSEGRGRLWRSQSWAFFTLPAFLAHIQLDFLTLSNSCLPKRINRPPAAEGNFKDQPHNNRGSNGNRCQSAGSSNKTAMLRCENLLFCLSEIFSLIKKMIKHPEELQISTLLSSTVLNWSPDKNPRGPVEKSALPHGCVKTMWSSTAGLTSSLLHCCLCSNIIVFQRACPLILSRLC